MRHLLSLSASESAKVLEKAGFKHYKHLDNIYRPHPKHKNGKYHICLNASCKMLIQSFIKKRKGQKNVYITIFYKLPILGKLPYAYAKLSQTNRWKYGDKITFDYIMHPCAIHFYEGATNRISDLPGLLVYHNSMTDYHEVRNTSYKTNGYNGYGITSKMRPSISKAGNETSLRDLEEGGHSVNIVGGIFT